MHRLDRKLRILREKRLGSFDSDQYFLERALRARAARKVRLLLRRNQPVVLVTPRWSEPQAFLDDLATDLRIGKPNIQARTFSVAAMHDRPINEAWGWVIRALIEFCGLHQEGPFGHAVDREGFRNVLRRLLARVRTGPRRALLIHNIEHLHLSVREDLVVVFGEYMESQGGDRRLNLLLAGSVDVPGALPAGIERVVLTDFSEAEAMEALVEHLGPQDRAKLDEAVKVVGGVPALLAAVSADERGAEVLGAGRATLMSALGKLADEVRGALNIVASDARLAERFELVAKHGPLLREDERDALLLRAGLIQEVSWGRPGRVEVRAPVFAEIALSS